MLVKLYIYLLKSNIAISIRNLTLSSRLWMKTKINQRHKKVTGKNWAITFLQWFLRFIFESRFL